MSSFDNTIIHTAGEENYIIDALFCNYKNLQLPLRTKPTFYRESTTLHYTEHAPYLNLLTLSLAITPHFLLRIQIGQNTKPLPATSREQIANTICAQVMSQPPVITTVVLTKIMMPENSSSAILRIASSWQYHQHPNHETLRLYLLHQCIQRSVKRTHFSLSNKSQCNYTMRIWPAYMHTTSSASQTTGTTVIMST